MKHKSDNTETRAFRLALVNELGRCERCGKRRRQDQLAVHEIACGSGIRQKAVDKRYAVLVLCSLGCHERTQNEAKELQLARLYLSRPGDLDCVRFNRLRGRADGAITVEEVMAKVEWLLEGGLWE